MLEALIRVGTLLVFFFSSRRRHTRLQGDWSSDVCSSDLRQRRFVVEVSVKRRDLPGKHLFEDCPEAAAQLAVVALARHIDKAGNEALRSEEHTSELQSPCNLVCRLLLEKKTLLATACSPY